MIEYLYIVQHLDKINVGLNSEADVGLGPLLGADVNLDGRRQLGYQTTGWIADDRLYSRPPVV